MSYFDSFQGYGSAAAPSFYTNPFTGAGLPGLPGGTPEVPVIGTPALGGATPGWMGQISDWARTNGLLDSKGANGVTTQGLAMPMISALGSIGNGYMALQQYGMAKDALASSKAQFNQQYAAQRQLTNANLEGRQREMAAAKYGSSTGAPANQDVAAYMSKYGVK